MTPLPRRLSAPALLLLVPMLAACGGFGAQTDQVYQAAVGANNRSGQVDVLNGLVVSDTNGTGTFAGTLVNKSTGQADQLISISDSTKQYAITVAPGGYVNLATSGEVRLQNSDLVPGNFVTLTLQFSSGQTTKIDVPVVQHAGDYANVPVGAAASPSATPSS